MDKHHAYLLYADSIHESAVPEAFKQQSTDVLHVIRDRFSIDDARELSSLAVQSPFRDPERVFVLETKDIAVEAQNALLKLFEEPPKHARFYLVIPRVSVLLPTLLSRVSVLGERDIAYGVGITEAFATFAASSYGDRLSTIAERTKNKDLSWIEEILRGCENSASAGGIKTEELLRSTLFARQYIRSKGSSAKMLLEELALDLPLQ